MKLIYDKVIMVIAPKLIKKNRKNILLTIEKLIEKHLIDNIKYLVLLDRIDELTESELDMVQEELHVDFYNYSMSVEEKRKSCKSSLGVHATKGTAESVVTVLNSFYQGAKLYEWYQTTNLVPGYFSVYYEGLLPENTGDILKRISSTKKASQHLKAIFSASKVEGRSSTCLIASNNSKNTFSAISNTSDLHKNFFGLIALETIKKQNGHRKIIVGTKKTCLWQGSVLESKQINKMSSISRKESLYLIEKKQIIVEKITESNLFATTLEKHANRVKASVSLQINNRTNILRGGF